MEMAPALLPHIFLVDVLDDGQCFRWRLIGRHIVRHAGSDDTGLDLGISIAPEVRPIVIGHYREVVRGRRFLSHRGNFIGRDGRAYRYERLLLPVLAAEGSAVDTVLGGAVFEAGQPGPA
jgi:hypothetical protein